MQHYIGVKMIQATPGQKDGVDGYNVIYPDGYASWSPKEVFENAYLPIELPNSLVAKDVESVLATVQATTLDPKTTMVQATLLTGFKLYETASCVCPDNYDEQLGAQIAMNKVNQKLWFALGFVLQWAQYGLKHVTKQES